MSLLGISGVNGSGKSTLASEFQLKHTVGFLTSEAGLVIEKLGYSQSADYDFKTRLMLQEAILDNAVERYESAKGLCVTDRTPLDFLSYMLSDVTRLNVMGDDVDRLLSFKKRCFDVTNKYFNVVVILQPGIEAVERAGKAISNKAYDEHYNALICGLAVSQELVIQHTFIPRFVVDINQRVVALEQSLNMAYNSFERTALRKGATQLPKSVH